MKPVEEKEIDHEKIDALKRLNKQNKELEQQLNQIRFQVKRQRELEILNLK